MTKEIISEKRLSKIAVRENNEKLVDLARFEPKIKTILPEYMKKSGLRRILVRKTVAEKLKKIQSDLPQNMQLVVTSGLRPLRIQEKIYLSFFKQNKKDHPKWSDSKIREETRKIVAPSDKNSPHSTGGAVDLTIYRNNKPVDMGCQIPMTIATKNPDIKKFPINSKYITKFQKYNRKFLSKIMEKHGFVNFESEWWHWSYGDMYWASKNRKKYTLYSSIKSP